MNPKRSHARQRKEHTSDRQLVQEIKRLTLEEAGDELISLYLLGSFLSKDMVESSDIDLIGIMQPAFNFNRERKINAVLNRKIESIHKIDLGTLSITELYGGPTKGSIMKHVELPILLRFLQHARLLHGKQIDLSKLPVKPATAHDELKYHIKVFDEFKEKFRTRNRITSDFAFKDFLKIVFYIANLELQLTRHLRSRTGYAKITQAFAKDKTHIVHYSMGLRSKKTIPVKERRRWLTLAEVYVAKMRAYATEQLVSQL